jgi:hypothetical protein
MTSAFGITQVSALLNLWTTLPDVIPIFTDYSTRVTAVYYTAHPHFLAYFTTAHTFLDSLSEAIVKQQPSTPTQDVI